eukprot:COSAG02_NODE_113_length_35905_cov_25.229012_13_plen_166_part_00
MGFIDSNQNIFAAAPHELTCIKYCLVDRVFWLRDTIDGILAWDKKKNNKPNKSSTIVDVEPSPAVRSAKEWFELIDADGSGELDQDELATLYQKARGEKLKGKQVFILTASTCVSATSVFAFRLPLHLKLFTDPRVSGVARGLRHCINNSSRLRCPRWTKTGTGQ